MPPLEPAIGREYILVGRIGFDVAYALYHRHGDGSAGYYANGVYAKAIGMDETTYASGIVCSADGSPTAWKPVWDELMALGMMELAEAQAAGIVAPDWQPPRRHIWPPPEPIAFLLVSGLSQPPSVRELSALRRVFSALADLSLTDLRARLANSSRWVAGGFTKEICHDLQARCEAHGLHVEIVEERPAAVRPLYPWY